jgi:hypothetical protein
MKKRKGEIIFFNGEDNPTKTLSAQRLRLPKNHLLSGLCVFVGTVINPAKPLRAQSDYNYNRIVLVCFVSLWEWLLSFP